MAGNKLNDWNDLHVSAGLNAVKTQLLSVVDKPSANDGNNENNPPPQNADARQRSLGDEQWQRNFQKLIRVILRRVLAIQSWCLKMTLLLMGCWVIATLVIALLNVRSRLF